ncbi:MAG: hypothetical protein ACTMII_13470 [Brachybacterium sp.]|uniref:hypothetical protein n=1 Tax=unclassified Brachybacterium TaxID=2623841 RepID=UPI003FDFE194
MNAFWGADTEALRTMGTVYSRRAEALADLEALLTSSIENIEWIGEDADRFRADWSGVVRPSLQDQEVELRQRARRLAQHADEQEAASAPDGPLGGFGGGSGGGGWSSPGEFLRDLLGMVEDALRGTGPGRGGPFAELLREVLSTPEGCAAFLGAFLGSLLGGLLADMIRSAIGMGLALEGLLTGLGLAGGLGNLIGESGQITPQDSLLSDEPAALGGAGGEDSAGGDAAGEDSAAGRSGGESAGGSGSGSGSGGASGSGGGSGGGGAGGESGAGAEAGVEGASEGAPAGDRSAGIQALENGPAQSAGSGPAGRITNDGEQGPRSLLERLLEMLGDALDPGAASGSVIGDRIGHS